RTEQLVVPGTAHATDGRISVDGRWLAYTSFQSGRPEIYVQPFPDGGRRWHVSTAGGERAFFNPHPGARELFYRQDEKLLSVKFEADPDFTPGAPELLFEGRQVYACDPMPDGEHFVTVHREERDEPSSIVIVQRWLDELTRLVPTGR